MIFYNIKYMGENSFIKVSSKKWQTLPQYVLFGIMTAAFLSSGIFLKVNIAYSLLVVCLAALGLVARFQPVSFLSLLPFSYALWEVKAVSLENIFLLSLGFVASYIFMLQFSASQGKEANPFFSYGAGLLLAAPYILFSSLQYKAFSSGLIVSPLGIMLIVFFIIFFRFQYLIWKGK